MVARPEESLDSVSEERGPGSADHPEAVESVEVHVPDLEEDHERELEENAEELENNQDLPGNNAEVSDPELNMPGGGDNQPKGHAQKLWALTKHETASTFESWRSNIAYSMSLNPEFSDFFEPVFTL